MGWYGESNEKCPNCGNKNANTQFHNDLAGPLYLICPDCGLRLVCREVFYKIKSAYIDKSIIKKYNVIDEIDLTETEERNENILDANLYKASHHRDE